MFEPVRRLGDLWVARAFVFQMPHCTLYWPVWLCVVPLTDLAHVQRKSSLVNGLVQRKPLYLSMNIAGFRQRHLDTKVRTWRRGRDRRVFTMLT